MNSSTATVSQEEQANQSNFGNEQRKHDCTDCGHSYLAPSEADGSFNRRVIGGGTIVTGKGPLREIHILPHCGTELPDDLLSEIDPARYPALADLVHDNLDLGTAAIYRMLVAQIRTGQIEGVAVAGFHLSRLLLDANRLEQVYQVPPLPYVGTPDLYADYQLRHTVRLREEALLPWLAAVNEVLAEIGGDGVAYHHHTYDVYSMSPRPWDRAANEKRPAFQLVWERPAVEKAYTGANEHADRGLARLEDLRGVRDRITEYLEAKLGLEDGAGDIDFPLLLPLGPFLGTHEGDADDTPQHILYDLRKDILATEEKVSQWVTDAPWRLASPARGDLLAGTGY